MGNCRPKKEAISRTISYTYMSGLVGGGSLGTSATINFAHTKKYWYEIDPANNTRKYIQNGSKKEKFTESIIKVPSGETNDGDVTFTSQIVKSQEYVAGATPNEVVPVFERFCKADNTYDEQYFYHIFEWPTSPSITRTVGGFQGSTTTTTTTTPGSPGVPATSTSTSSSAYDVVSSTVSLNLSLSRVDSEIANLPTNTIAYHGGTNDNKIFFKYSVTTDVVLSVGDVVNGWTVDKVINYNVDKALRRRVTDQSKKDKTPSYVIVSSSVDDVNVGDGVLGKGIPAGTTVTEVIIAEKKVKLSNAINQKKKIRSVVFTSAALNKITSSTLCYAEISGGSANFNTTTTYTATGSGAQINVEAGKGINNRSAVVGMYFSKDKKVLEYTPLFYNKNTDCEPPVSYESLGDFVTGTIVLNDGTALLSGAQLCVSPKGNLNYIISDVYWKNFGRPVDKVKLQYWIDKNASEKYTLEELEAAIIDENKIILGDKKIYQVIDDACGNDISSTYEMVYNPYKELNQTKNMLSAISGLTFDECADIKSPDAYSVDELKNLISNGIQNSISSSSIVMPEEMYKQFISNENSLMNTLLKAVDTVEKSIPDKSKMPQLPATIAGENKATVPLVLDRFRRLPPKYSKLEYLVSDVTLLDDTALLPNSPESEVEITIRSIPRYTGSASIGGQTGDDVSSNGIRVITNKTGGFVTSVTTAAGTIPQPTLNLAGNQTATPVSWTTPTAITPSGDNDTLEARPYPFTVWEQGTNYQFEYNKLLQFRIQEVSDYVGETIENKGNGFQDDLKLARLTSTLTSAATTISVNSTNGFLSSGFLIIPKYIQKKELKDNGNIETYFYYLGEEIIYYKSKTATSFNNCLRNQYGTTSTFEIDVPASEIEEGVTYIIKTLGNTNWSAIGAPSGYAVGTIFTSNGISSGSGTATKFESSLTPFESAPLSNAVFHSYEKGYDIAQYWPYQIQG